VLPRRSTFLRNIPVAVQPLAAWCLKDVRVLANRNLLWLRAYLAPRLPLAALVYAYATLLSACALLAWVRGAPLKGVREPPITRLRVPSSTYSLI